MTIRNLDHLFKPRSVALIGASARPQSVGAVVARNLFRAGFDGPVMPVNPKRTHIQSVAAYKDVASLPATPDLAVIATPPETVPGLVAELGARGTRAAIVITAGINDGEAGLRQAMLDAARPHLLRIIGPNCLGIVVPGIGLDASFAQLAPAPGSIAFVAQSGAVITSVLDWASARGIGFSHLVSMGDMADVDFGDMLDYLANQAETHAILLYIEAITQARKFMSAARAAARTKPVIVVKAGRTLEAAKAAASHTGAMAGADEVYDAVFRRAGMLRVGTLEDLFDAVETLSTAAMPKGDRLAIVSNGGGVAVMATDALIDKGGRLATLTPDTIARLDRILPATWPRANPVDIIGDAPGARYHASVGAVLEDPGVDALLVLNCPTAIASGIEGARSVIEAAGARKRRPPVFTSWIGEATTAEARAAFAEARLPTYDTPTDAVSAFMQMVTYRRNQEALAETPPSIPETFTPGTARARKRVAEILANSRAWMTGPEARDVLAAYGIPLAEARVAQSPDEAARAAREIGGRVAIKILSPDITHKSDVGGVALDVPGPEEAAAAAAAMLAAVPAAAPGARIEGVTVEPMIERPHALELILGVTDDAQFGPMILVGQGGVAVEAVRDTALAMPPLNMRLAREAIARTRIHRLLAGYRDVPAADLDAVALTMIKLSHLVIDLPEIVELDINPLLADAQGVIALDARIRVAPAHGARCDRLAIRPYPRELETRIGRSDGGSYFLRPVIPEDEPEIQALFSRLTPEQVRLRFLSPMKFLSHPLAARLTQIDYDREMALVLTDGEARKAAPIYGVVRLTADPDIERGEFAIVLDPAMTGRGLGAAMMRHIIDYARGRGMGEIWGEILRENGTMLKLCRQLGFETRPEIEDVNIMRATLALRA